jgi:hypothetical protein
MTIGIGYALSLSSTTHQHYMSHQCNVIESQSQTQTQSQTHTHTDTSESTASPPNARYHRSPWQTLKYTNYPSVLSPQQHSPPTEPVSVQRLSRSKQNPPRTDHIRNSVLATCPNNNDVQIYSKTGTGWELKATLSEVRPSKRFVHSLTPSSPFSSPISFFSMTN